ncbi:universal stress protein [Betaproteobacteria bacterium PRO7]|jgi:nucleotide-binding universal stress UspA family protein|nr:universal stress protein [Betaproteobacteria bacterium PRO7]
MALPPKHILCATDFSVASGAAQRRAALAAAQYGARLTLLHVVPASLWEDAADELAGLAGLGALDPGQAERDAALRLQRHAEEIGAGFGRPCDAQVRYGRTAAQIAAAARELGADLLVVGAHGAHPVRDLAMGTTAQRLLRIAPCPVLVVKRPPPFDYRSVLLPTDFSAPAAQAAEAARALLPDALFHLVHAFELPYDGLMRHAGVDDATVQTYRTAAQCALAARLADLAAAFGAPPGRAAAHVRHGYAPTRIDEWIVELATDLVAIAAHGKSEVQAAFLGSVSTHVVQTASCDVLLVRDGAQAPRA